MKRFLSICAVTTALAAGVMAKEQKINVPEGSSEATEKAILALKPGEVDSKLWSSLGKYRFGDDPKLIYVLEAALISAGAENHGKIEDELLTVVNNRSSTDDGRQFACRLLQRIGTEKCVPSLSKLLTDEKMSHFARLALEDIPAPDAIRGGLSKAPDSLKPGLIGSIGEIGSNKDVPLLSKYAADKNTAVSGSALRALAKIGSADALQALKTTRPDDSLKNIHRDALMSAALLNGDASVFKKLYAESDKNRSAALRGWLRVEESSAVSEICSIMTSPDNLLRGDAIQIITMEPSRKLTEELCVKLSSVSDKGARMELISALGTRGDSVAVKTVITFAGDSDTDIANTALTALGELNSAESISVLLKKMKSPAHAGAARAALAVINCEEIDSVLISSLKDSSLTVPAINILAERMTRSASPDLIMLLNDRSADVRKAAWAAIPDICAASDTEAIITELVKLQDKRDISRAAKAVVALASNVDDRKACFDSALKFNENADEPVRNLILDLGAIAGTPEALEMVKVAYASDDKELKARALRALSAWSTVNAAPTLEDLAENGEDEVTRVLALRGLIRLASLDWRELVEDKRNFDKGMDRKYEMLESASKLANRKEEKTSIISALGEMGNTKRMQELELVMTYIDDPEVKEEAELATLNLAKRLAKHKPAEVLPIAQKLYETTEIKHIKFHANKAIEICKAGEKKK